MLYRIFLIILFASPAFALEAKLLPEQAYWETNELGERAPASENNDPVLRLFKTPPRFDLEILSTRWDCASPAVSHKDNVKCQ